MRLVNVTTLELEEFVDERAVPSYVILSHRWETEEVTFQQFTSPDKGRTRKGFQKIQQFCLEVQNAGLEYAWVDTCCIDKSSSAELSEAINSMYRWYQLAEICYAYLSDVHVQSLASERRLAGFGKSEWFKRGWTLQELIAPRHVLFFNSKWKILGSKTKYIDEVSEISGIDAGCLLGGVLQEVSVATKFSWAARRKTTRIEDQAYCLMGLFEVNMPLLYGEGDRAFRRLQEEIIKQTEDQSIFAWSSPSLEQDPWVSPHELWAPSAAVFVDWPHSSRLRVQERENRLPFQWTHMGLSIEAQVWRYSMNVYRVALDYTTEADGFMEQSDHRGGIYIMSTDRANHFIRVSVKGRATWRLTRIHGGFRRSIFIHHQLVGQLRRMVLYGFWIRKVHLLCTPQNEYKLSFVCSRNTWDDHQRVLVIPNGSELSTDFVAAGILVFRDQSSPVNWIAIRLSFNEFFDPVCEIHRFISKDAEELVKYEWAKIWEFKWAIPRTDTSVKTCKTRNDGGSPFGHLDLPNHHEVQCYCAVQDRNSGSETVWGVDIAVSDKNGSF